VAAGTLLIATATNDIGKTSESSAAIVAVVTTTTTTTAMWTTRTAAAATTSTTTSHGVDDHGAQQHGHHDDRAPDHQQQAEVQPSSGVERPDEGDRWHGARAGHRCQGGLACTRPPPTFESPYR
jgi:hypothetical protein